MTSLDTFREEILSEALAICRGRPAGDLRRPRIAHLRALIAIQRGQIDLALAYLTRAIQLDPAKPAPYHDAADLLLRKGRDLEALGMHLYALRLALHEAVGYARLGSALRHMGRRLEAAAALREAIRLRPEEADYHGELGHVLREHRRPEEALDEFVTSRQLAPTDADAHHRVGRGLLELGRTNDALTAFRQGLEQRREHAGLHTGIGEALLRLGSVEEAVNAFYSALTISPRDVTANRQYVLAIELLGRRGDAVGGWINLGVALEGQRRSREACAAYGQALTRKADSLRALFGLARVHVSMGEPGGAVHHLQKAIEIDPEHAEAHTNLGLALQQTGQTADMARSWDELTWYHHPRNPTWRHVEQPVWDGSPLEGRRLFLWMDRRESHSHTIQFLRYVQFAKALGGRVLVECDRALVPLVKHAPGLDDVIAMGGPLLPHEVHAPLMHFPALVKAARTAVAAATTVPYLAVPDDLRRRWHERVAEGIPPKSRHDKVVGGVAPQSWHEKVAGGVTPKIGIAWAGSLDDEYAPSHFASLSAFAPFAAMSGVRSGVRFLSLQLGPYGHELIAPPRGFVVESLLEEASPIADVAALIVSLDLVITVDSRVAHLAGALGVPVWTMLSRGAGWPWPAEGDRTTWYPTMRLFRQTRAGDWTEPFERARAAWEEMRTVTRRHSTAVH